MKASKDLKEFIRILEEFGEICRIQKEVDSQNYELSSFIRHIEDGPNKAILFEKVKGYSMPVVANLYGSVRRCALGVGIVPSKEDIQKYGKDPRGSIGGLGGISIDSFTMNDEERTMAVMLREKILEIEERASKGEFSVEVVKDGPCKEVKITKDIDVLMILPVPRLCEKDGGGYINPSVGIMRDPDSGILNVGGYRHMVLPERYGKDKIGVFIVETNDGNKIIEKMERKGEKYAEIALCVGPNPAVNLMGWYTSPHLMAPNPWSEYNSASGLLGEPPKIVKCETVDLEVPIDTEVVIEGKIPIHERILEGPMAEYTEVYAVHRPSYFIEVTAITHRKDAIFHVLLSGRSREHATGGLVTGWGFEEAQKERIRRVFPSVKDVSFAAGSHCFHLIVSLKQTYSGEDKRLLYHLAATTPWKYITIVDDDIDVHSTEQVEWARAMRAGTPDDFYIFPKMHGFDMDPLTDEHLNHTKLGILATLPFGEKFERCSPPQEMLMKTREDYEREMARYGLK